MSHRRRANENGDNKTSTTDIHVRQNATTIAPGGTTGRKHLTPSTSSRRHRPLIDKDEPPTTKQVRPSGIPRSVSHSSKTPGDPQSSSKGFARPSHASKVAGGGSSMGSRKVASSEVSHSALPSSRMDLLPGLALTTDMEMEEEDDAVLGIALPRTVRPSRPAILPPRLIPELQALASTPPVRSDVQRSASTVSSASGRYSESPGPWSTSTAMTTPTSWSSASPGVVQYVGGNNKRSHTVPVPATTKSRLPRMPALPESRHSSFESGTALKDVPAVQESTSPASRRKKRTPLTSPAPTPPPRSSSAKRTPAKKKSSQNLRTQAAKDSDIVPLHFDPAASPFIHQGVDNSMWTGAYVDHPELFHQHDHFERYNLTDPGDELGLDSYPSYTDRDRYILSDTPSKSPTRHFDDGEQLGYNPTRPLTSHTMASTTLREGTPTDTILSSEDDRPPSRSRLGKFSRLGIFGRRSKEPGESPSKLQKKGPAAGTGHEGYGRYTRGRKYSTDTAKSTSDTDLSTTGKSASWEPKPRTRSISTRGNRSSQSDLDGFTAQRLKPVVMVGGSRRDLQGQDHLAHRIADDSAIQKADYTRPQTAPHEVAKQPPSHVPRTPVPSTPPSQYLWQSEDERPTLAMRRSQKFGSPSGRFPIPAPILTTTDAQMQSGKRSRATSQASSLPHTPAHSSSRREASITEHSPQRKEEKKSRKLRWNPFRRKEPQPKPTASASARNNQQQWRPEVAVAISAGPQLRSMPYYAMMESESEIISTEPETLGGFLAQAIESPHGSPKPAFNIVPSRPLRDAFEQGKVLPSSKTGKTGPPADGVGSVGHLHVDEAELRVGPSTRTEPRQPRLAQVGRIPKVVPRNQNRGSFSRPFQQPPAASIESGFYAQPQAASMVTSKIHPDRTGNPPSSPTWQAFTAAIRDPEAALPNEFLSFPTKAPSEYSLSTSSEGAPSVLAPAFQPHARFTSVSRGPQEATEGLGMLQPVRRAEAQHISSRRSHLAAEDEVWNEYDDFLDQVLSPVDSKDSGAVQEILNSGNESVTGADLHGPIRASGVLGRHLFRTQPRTASRSRSPALIFPPSSLQAETEDVVHLRRSRIVSALRSSTDPSSPFSVGDYLGEDANSNRRGGHRTSTSSADQSAVISSSLISTAREYQHQEKSKVLDLVERAKDPIAQSELHYTSLMVSRWLSFGRVLFSPAHDEIMQNPQKHVLVIDGLGNEDWSLYCAVTYEPQNAFIHDLRETASTRLSQTSRYSGQVPTNYRRSEIPSLGQKFPFPERFFSVVVLRFPPSLPDRKMQNILTECKRVLAPGGYMELMLLDLDIVNAGVHTRRKMRELKINMTAIDRSISLKPIIDNVQSLLGTTGFSSLNRCIVGVPVAGRPISLESASSSSHGSYAQAQRPRADPQQTGELARSFQHFGGEGFSLNDLVADQSDTADAKIGRMVSRTARSWWQHSFESAIMIRDPQSKSMFSNKEVLKECKARASSFKLLIGHIQKPTLEVRRRTMSEPTVSTMATVGALRK